MNIAGSCYGMIHCGSLSAFSGADLVVLVIIIAVVVALRVFRKRD